MAAMKCSVMGRSRSAPLLLVQDWMWKSISLEALPGFPCQENLSTIAARRSKIEDSGLILWAVLAQTIDSGPGTFSRGVTPGFMYAEDGFGAGASGFNFPIDTGIFKKPHLPACSFDLSSFLHDTLRWRKAELSASYRESPRGRRGRKELEISGGCASEAESVTSR
jgi:hypothetical protein